MQQAGDRRGIRFRGRSRKIIQGDWQAFDLILAMDDNNLADLQALRPADDDALLARFLDVLGEDGPHEVPDPYYGGDDGFDHVLNLVEKASDLWLERLRERL